MKVRSGAAQPTRRSEALRQALGAAGVLIALVLDFISWYLTRSRHASPDAMIRSLGQVLESAATAVGVIGIMMVLRYRAVITARASGLVRLGLVVLGISLLAALIVRVAGLNPVSNEAQALQWVGVLASFLVAVRARFWTDD